MPPCSSSPRRDPFSMATMLQQLRPPASSIPLAAAPLWRHLPLLQVEGCWPPLLSSTTGAPAAAFRGASFAVAASLLNRCLKKCVNKPAQPASWLHARCSMDCPKDMMTIALTRNATIDFDSLSGTTNHEALRVHQGTILLLFGTEVMVAMTTSATPFRTKDQRMVQCYTTSTRSGIELFLPQALGENPNLTLL
ncbi:hypothetical protein U9M48_034597 [Paspalum notatum var. saurae]